jgi:hypothetical protein
MEPQPGTPVRRAPVEALAAQKQDPKQIKKIISPKLNQKKTQTQEKHVP